MTESGVARTRNGVVLGTIAAIAAGGGLTLLNVDGERVYPAEIVESRSDRDSTEIRWTATDLRASLGCEDVIVMRSYARRTQDDACSLIGRPAGGSRIEDEIALRMGGNCLGTMTVRASCAR